MISESPKNISLCLKIDIKPFEHTYIVRKYAEIAQHYYRTQIFTSNINPFGLRMIMIILSNGLMFSSEFFARKKEVWALELSMIGIISNKKRLNCDLANVQRKHNMSAICMRQSSFAILVIEKLK